MSHADARLTPRGRLLIVQRAQAGWPESHIAKAMGLSRTCVTTWVNRYLAEGEAGLGDRSSRPHSSPSRTAADREAEVPRVRAAERSGRDDVAERTGVPPGTVSRILVRHGIPKLAALDPITGEVIRSSKSTAVRYEQVASLAVAVDDRSHGSDLGYGLLVMVLAYCGLRWVELAGLRPTDVDLRRARLEVRQTVVMDKGYQRVEAPKDYEHRSNPAPGFLLEPLRSQIAGRPSGSSVFLAARTRTWLRNRSFRDGWFDPAAAQVGQPGLTPHELRHIAASLAVSAGANVKAVQLMLGHASAAITLDRYADLFEDDLDAIAVAPDRAAVQTDVFSMWAERPTGPSVDPDRNEETPG